MHPNVEKAIELAVLCHQGQIDVGGEPHIAHVNRIVLKMKSDTAKIVAALHDTVEDGEMTFEQIERTFGPFIREAVDALTKRIWERYEDYIQRVKLNPVAVEVKIADLEDNMNPLRIRHKPEMRRKILEARYKAALEVLKP